MELIDRYVGENKNVKRNQTETILAQLADISLARNHILKAIEDGISAPHFSERLDDLKAQEERLQAELVLSNQSRDLCCVTEKEIKLLINRFHFMRKEQDLVELRKIVLDFVKSVTVTDGKIDVALKISFGNVVIDHVPA